VKTAIKRSAEQTRLLPATAHLYRLA